MIQQSFANVWDAIEETPANIARMKARADLIIAIRNVIEQWDSTQADAAKKLGVTQPRLNDLLRGRIDKFSLDALINMAASAGLKVALKIQRSAA